MSSIPSEPHPSYASVYLTFSQLRPMQAPGRRIRTNPAFACSGERSNPLGSRTKLVFICRTRVRLSTETLSQGVPFDPDDAMFNPPSPRRSTAVGLTPTYPPVHPLSLQTAPPPNTQPQAVPPPQTQPQSQPPPSQTQTQAQPPSWKRETPGHVQRVISLEEDMRRLFQECRFAHGNAQLLSEALAFASPEDLREKDIIKVRTRIFLVGEATDSVSTGMVFKVC